ncbi:endoribonuclease Dicer homolog 1 isoform X1 [Selaginella moellendorffii]|nr:endoribonuclease Dicer homolog 1 isoform X1 [Selaginella moellendorffii]|eukprot:XP_024538863.1 endoribonuclease Dicer homolog 1 isoform X1 [Selaginella moellendorffii]
MEPLDRRRKPAKRVCYENKTRRRHGGCKRERERDPEEEGGREKRAYLEKDADGRNVLKFGIRVPAARGGAGPVTEPSTQNGSAGKAGKEKVCVEQARAYQLEVLSQAEEGNTIAFLETGAGKTLIAVLLMKRKAELLQRKILTVFLVPKVPLVYQQAEVIRERTNFNVGHYCGEMVQDFWDSKRWQREFQSKEVLVMTAQILLNILRHSIVRMEDIDLLILDECHHAVKKHPYSLVMSEFYHLAPKEKRPKIFGMTASPVNLKGVSNQEDCAVKIRNLETKLDSVVCTIRDRKELEKHVPMPSETVVEYDKAAVLWSLREKIKQMKEQVEEACSASSKRTKWQFMGARDAGASDELHFVYGVAERKESDGAANLLQKLRSIIFCLDELGQWCAYKVASSSLGNLRHDERTADVKYQELYLTKIVDMLKCDLQQGAASSSKLEAVHGDVEEGEVIDTNSLSGGEHFDEVLGAAVADKKVTPKVQSLIQILRKYEHVEDFRAIIFVDRVVAALTLPCVLSELPSLKYVRSGSLVGHNNSQDVSTRHMHDSLSKFRDGSLNVLVATSVAEEGLDIRQCNVVVRFDLAKTVLAYIQSRGRARKPGSDYILMLEKGNKVHQSFLRNARNSEETLRKEATERTKLDPWTEAAIVASLEDGKGETYQVPSTGAMVTLNSAVGLIHFYCSQLPSDRYSILKPEFVLTKHSTGDVVYFSCKLRLPSNAPVESFDGPVCSTMKGAQQAVCLEACKKLHEMAAFTDMLLPDTGTPDKSDKGEDNETTDPIPGTARYREYFPEGIADFLKGDWILNTNYLLSTSLYMYIIQYSNVGFSTDPLVTQTSDFAVLFGREMDPEVLTASVDLFVARTLTTQASLVFSGVHHITSSELTLLKAFHVRLMSIVLDVDVEPASTPWDSNKAYLFVPLTSSCTKQIDWALMNKVLGSHAWSSPLQRARPDVFLGTNERALGGDRREYGFSKLRSNGVQKHPTYGIRGAVAEFDVIKASGIAPLREKLEPEGRQLLLADGYANMDEMDGKLVTAAHSGKRFYVESVMREMTAESPFPRKEGYLGSVEYSSYADYYEQKYGVRLHCRHQPMLRCRGVSHCKNLLSPRFKLLESTFSSFTVSLLADSWSAVGSEELSDKTYYVMLPPEICLVHPLPGCLVRGAQRLPSVMKRVESILLAVQLKHEIGFPIPAAKVLEALTAASCQETFSYERAELLGDAYLKWVVSRRLFIKHPRKHEGQLTRMRQQTVSNMVLYEFAISKSLQSYIQSDRFAPSRWAAPGVPPVFDEDLKDANLDNEAAEVPKANEHEERSTKSSGEEEVLDDSTSLEDGEAEWDSSSYRVLSSKTLADVVEALIGVYYVEGGTKAAAHFMNWINIPIDYDEAEANAARAGCSVPDSVMNSIDFEKLELAIGYKFQMKSVLVEAISHASRPSAGVPCYQRLEFVGDAVLDHLITRYLFFRYQDLPPGRLTDLRAAAVNNENFARISVKHSFHLHLRHGSSALEAQIKDFVKDIQSELDKPGINSFGIGDFKAPKVLGDILESIAGAIFLDTGLAADEVWKVFERLLEPMVTPDTLPVHPVRELQERCQQQAEGLEYRASREGSIATVEVFVDGVQIGCAQNTQKKMAQKLAARNALAALKERDSLEEESNKVTKMENDKANAFTRQTLNDICLQRQWPMPQYRLLSESGPAHAKRFTYTVRVNTRERGWTDECEGQAMPSMKKAKDSAALVLLEVLKQWDDIKAPLKP